MTGKIYFTQEINPATFETVIRIRRPGYEEFYSDFARYASFLSKNTGNKAAVELEQAGANEEAIMNRLYKIIGKIDMGSPLDHIRYKNDVAGSKGYLNAAYRLYTLALGVSGPIGYVPHLSFRFLGGSDHLAVAVELKPEGIHVTDFISDCLMLLFPSSPEYGTPAVKGRNCKDLGTSLSVVPYSGVKAVLEEAKEVCELLAKDGSIEEKVKAMPGVTPADQMNEAQILHNQRVVKILKALGRDTFI